MERLQMKYQAELVTQIRELNQNIAWLNEAVRVLTMAVKETTRIQIEEVKHVKSGRGNQVKGHQ